jgi:hypothetical protein
MMCRCSNYLVSSFVSDDELSYHPLLPLLSIKIIAIVFHSHVASHFTRRSQVTLPAAGGGVIMLQLHIL